MTACVPFLDLEEAFDSVQHEVICWLFEMHNILEEYIEWVIMFYDDAKSHIRRALLLQKSFRGSVHQGPVFSPLLLITVISSMASRNLFHRYCCVLMTNS